MTLEVGRRHQRHGLQWRVLLVVPIIIAIGAIGFLLYDTVSQSAQLRTEQSYRSTVDQSLSYNVRYLDNNYFDTSRPSASSAAYVRELTDTIVTDFSHLFKTDKMANLSYTYAITSQVTASYTPKGTSDARVVWSASYPLTKTVSGSSQNGEVRVASKVEIPFRDYSARIARINSGLALALDAKAVVTFSITVSGIADGLPVNEQRTMQMTIPLDQSVYAIATNYEQRDAKTVLAEDGQQEGWWRTYRIVIMIVSVLVAVGSLTLLIYPWRRRDAERNPYRRELNRIYRYHDGLIIHTQKPFNMTGREGLSVMSFDDLLSLSEELHVPIIASKLSSDATRFLVIHDGTVYSYLVGEISTGAQTLPVPQGTKRKVTSRK